MTDKQYAPHQQRVIDELDELFVKTSRLKEFVKGPVFEALKTEEQELLQQQLIVMQQYIDILNKRIALF